MLYPHKTQDILLINQFLMLQPQVPGNYLCRLAVTLSWLIGEEDLAIINIINNPCACVFLQ